VSRKAARPYGRAAFECYGVAFGFGLAICPFIELLCIALLCIALLCIALLCIALLCIALLFIAWPCMALWGVAVAMAAAKIKAKTCIGSPCYKSV
jgi:hypothetical protein